MAQIARDKDKQWQSNRTQQSEPIAQDAHAVEREARGTEPASQGGPGPRPHFPRVGEGAAHHFVEPMKCLPVKKIPEGEEWIYELKFDGYRSLAIVRGRRGAAALAQQEIIQRALSRDGRGGRRNCR